MKRTFIIIPILIVVGFTIILFLNRNDTQQIQEVSSTKLAEFELTNGENINLTKEEAALTTKGNEKKVILTDLGMT
jgi:hypothetical protein